MTAEFIVAVHAAVFLQHKKSFCTSEQIAQNVCTNPARVRKVMARLKRAGIVTAHTSLGGGYRLAREGEKITLAELLAATEEQVVSVGWRSGSECANCPISRSMAPVMDNIFDQMEADCRAGLARVTVASLEQGIIRSLNGKGENSHE